VAVPALQAERLRRTTDDRTQVGPGYGFRPATLEEVETARALDRLDGHFFQVWEMPRRKHSYVLGCDVSDGLGLNRSVIDVVRRPTIEEPAEEVAQFISDRCKPTELAFVIDAIGHLYVDDEGLEAKAAIEINNHGLATQEMLQLHLGYHHFYRWEVMNAADPSRRMTTGLGWRTTPATRPILLTAFYDAVTAVDPLTGNPDLIVNSPRTLQDMRDFQTEGALWEAAASNGAQDDCVIALAIAYYIAHRDLAGEREPLAERRRRFHAIRAREQRLQQESQGRQGKPDFRNLPYTASELDQMSYDPDRSLAEDLDALMDVRGVIYDVLEDS
jgi:hypothetical protein